MHEDLRGWGDKSPRAGVRREDFAPGDGIASFGVTIADAHLVAWAGMTYDR